MTNQSARAERLADLLRAGSGCDIAPLQAGTPVTPADCIFIDDSPYNVDGARAVGMGGIQFTNADAVEVCLRERAVL